MQSVFDGTNNLTEVCQRFIIFSKGSVESTANESIYHYGESHIDNVTCMFCEEQNSPESYLCPFNTQSGYDVNKYGSHDNVNVLEYITRTLSEKSYQEIKSVYGSTNDVFQLLSALNIAISKELEYLRKCYIDCQVELNQMILHVESIELLRSEFIEMGHQLEAGKLFNNVFSRKVEILSKTEVFSSISTLYNRILKVWACSTIIYKKYVRIILNGFTHERSTDSDNINVGLSSYH